jgi:F-type H+-transporting ATPase subunit epsilon
MAETLKLEIISPSGQVYEGDVEHVQAPGQNGYFGVLANHTPMIAALEVGQIEADLPGGGKDLFATSGGVAEVHGDRVVILAETAEAKSSIDVERAEASVKRAEDRLQSDTEGVDFERAQASLKRALNRVDIIRG